MMPWIILTIISLIWQLIQSIIILGLTVALALYLALYLPFVALEVHLFIVVWSYRFQDILRNT